MEFDLSPLWISLKTATCATVITFFLGIAAAYWMVDYRGKGKGLIEGLLISPLVLPPTVVGFLLLLLFGRNGPLGQLLRQLGVTVIFSWAATAIAATVVAFPLMYKTAQGAFAQIDPNLLRAARTLGASEVTVFWRVILPLALPGIVAGTVLTFARALGEFGATLMLAGNIPGKTQTIPVAIYFAVEAGDMRQASIWVLIILAISLTGLTAVNSLGRGRGGEGELGVPFGDKRARGRVGEWESGRVGEGGLVVDVRKELGGFCLETSFISVDALGVLGASGAGKSMLLGCIAGLETPSWGGIVLNGRVLFDSKQGIDLPPRDRRVGFVFQNYALFPHLNVAQNIAFGLRHLPKVERDRRVDEQLERVQLQDMENRYPQQLSGGQQQRVALARALAIEPEVLLLDEPFSALDTHLRSQMEKQLIELLATYSGVTLLVTHNLEEAYRTCQNLLVLAEGRVVAQGDKKKIFKQPNTKSVAQLTGCKNFSNAVAISPQLVEATDWGCTCRVVEQIPETLAHVGIRAFDLIFSGNPNQENTFPCWLVQTSETPYRITLYLKLHHPPSNPQDYNLQAEVSQENWLSVQAQPQPWYVFLDPLRLILMSRS